MADKAAGAAPTPNKPKKSRKLPMLIGIVLIIALNGLVLGKVFLGGRDHSHKKTHAKAGPDGKSVDEEDEEEELGPKIALEEFLLNLAGNDGHYLKMVMTVAVKKGVTEEKLKEESAPIRDAVITVVCAKKLADISSEAGRDKLKADLKDQINRAVKGKPVRKIYFTEFATQ